MNRGKAPGARQEQARRILLHLLGGGDLRALVLVVAVLVSMGWLTDSLFEWMSDVGDYLHGRPVADWFPLHRLVSVGSFGLLLGWLLVLAAGARKRYRPRVGKDEQPAQARGLILFLSSLIVDESKQLDQPKALREKLKQLDGIEAFRAHFGRLNWRMPLEAIAYHLPRLDHVIVICSQGELGSAKQLPLFRELCGRVFAAERFHLKDAGELDSRFGHGLSFEDVDTVSRATDHAFQWLLDQGIAVSDILIDITGGQKPNAAAATAVALAEGRRIEYVTFDYRVTVYDVTYDL